MSFVSATPRCIDYYVLCFCMLSVAADTLKVNESNFAAQDEDTRNSSFAAPSCEFNITNMVEYYHFGEDACLLVSVDLLPSFCKNYQLEIELYSGICNSTMVLHTPRRLGSNTTNQRGEKYPCSPDTAIPSMANKLLELFEEKAIFKLPHVYSGNYCLFVYIDQEAAMSESYQENFTIDNNVTSFACPNAWTTTINVFFPSTGKILVEFTLPDPKYDISQFIVSLQQVNGNCENMGVWASPTVLGSICAKPRSKNEQNQPSMRVEFVNITDGNYCVLITPFDVRCHPDAIYWKRDQHSTCTRFYPGTFTMNSSSWIEPVLDPMCCSPVDWKIIGIGTVFTLSAFATALVLLWRFRKGLKTMICNTTPVTVPVPMKDAIPKHQPSIATVLLLYATDDPILCQAVQKLKHVLTIFGFCNVFDFRDESTYDLLATHGPSWISNLIASPDTKVISVVSAGAVEAQKITQGIGTNSPNSEGLTDPLDYVYLRALKEVMILGSETNVVYQRCFSVGFPGITAPKVALSSITPFVLFMLPENTEQLLWHIHGHLPEKSFWNADCNLW